MKVYRRFLASYLCVCLLPLLFSTITTINLEGNIQSSIARDQEMVLQNARREMDQSLSHAVNTVEMLSQEMTIGSLSEKTFLQGMELFDLCELIRTFSAMTNLQPVYSFGFCYFPRSGFLVTNEGMYHPELAGLFAWKLGVDSESFFSLMEEDIIPTHIRTVYKKDGRGYLVVLRNLYDSRYREIRSCLGIVIQFDSEILPWSSDTSEAFVTDEDGRLLYGGDRAEAACGQALRDGQDSGQVEIESRQWLYSFYASNLSRLRYGFLVLRDTYYEDLHALLWQLSFEVAFAFLVGIACAVFWSRRTWSPIKSMLPFVEKSSPEGEQTEYRSMASLTRAFTDFAQKKEQLENLAQRSQEKTRTISIWRYLLGLTDDASILSQFIEEGQTYRLLVFFPSGTGEAEAPADREACMGCLQNALEDVFLEKEAGVSLLMENCAVILVQKTMEKAEIAQAVSQVQQRLSRRVICYVSDICLRLSDAPEAWSWVHQAYYRDDFWQYDREPGVWMASDLLGNEEYRAYEGFLSQQRLLAGYLAGGKLWKARSCLEKLVEEELSDQSLPVEIIRHRYAGISELLLPYLPDGKYGDIERQVLRYHTAGRMKAGLLELFDQLQCAPDARAADDKSQQLAQRVQSYIRQNYRDPVLNVSTIADALGMNLSTLSHQYKSAAGHGVLDELHAVRLEAAKKMLKEGKSVRETAEQTGYADSRALIRTFKRYEGVTPGQYAGGEYS